MAAELIGLASGLLTLAGFALKTSQLLYEEISGFKSQNETVVKVLGDLNELVKVLTTIEARAQQPGEVMKLEPIRNPLWHCITACKEMREMLDACTALSTDRKARVKEWVKMRYHEKSLNDIDRRLSRYKATLIVAFQLVAIQEQSATQESLSDLKEQIAETKEHTEEQLDEIQQTIGTASASLRKVLEEDQARLQNCLDSIAQAQRTTDNIQPRIVIRDVCHDEGSRAMTGTDWLQPGLDLTVENVKVGVGAISGVGAFSPQTFQTFLQSSSPDLAPLLQALNTQSHGIQNEAFYSALNNMSAKRNQGAPCVSTSTLLIGASEHVSSEQHTKSVQPEPTDTSHVWIDRTRPNDPGHRTSREDSNEI